MADWERISNLYADITTEAGSAVGTVTSIISWSYHEIIDGVGAWDMTVHALPTNEAVLAEGYRCEIYGTIDSVEQSLTSGYVTGIRPAIDRDATLFYLDGEDRLGELRRRVVPSLKIREQAWSYITTSGAVRWIDGMGISAERDLTDVYDGNPATYNASDFRLGDHWWLYVGFDMPFSAIRLAFQTLGSTGSEDNQYQYYSNSTGWTNLAGLTDATTVGADIFRQDGIISWTEPTDWARNTPTTSSGSWFWMRIRTDSDAEGNTINDIKLYEIEVYADKPTTNALNLIMAYAPTGWDTSGYPATAGSAYFELSGQTVLQALEMLRQQIGGHYRVLSTGLPA